MPAFKTGDPKADAIDYAKGRFGGSAGEIHVYDDAGTAIVEKIQIDGRVLYNARAMSRQSPGLRRS